MDEYSMPKKDEDKDLNNELFWLEMTKLGTLRYCHEFLKFSQEFQRQRQDNISYEEHLKSLDEQIINYIDLLVDCNKQGCWGNITPEDSPFPSDLHGYIHEYNTDGGWFQPKHLMCKLGVLRDDVNKINYEFLIEYDILSPDVEIYFGVKAISDNWNSTDEFRNIVMNHWNKVRSKRYLRYAHRFKMTNNVNHGTFWPFWWRMSIDCKEELADTIQRIKTFYGDYKKEHGFYNLKTPIFDKVATEVANSLLSKDDYNRLIDKIEREFNKDVVRRFEMVLQKCVEEGILSPQHRPGLTYNCTGKIVDVVSMIRCFFVKTINGNSEWHYTKHTPFKYFSKVILDRHGRIINDSHWRKDSGQIGAPWDKSYKIIEEMFRNHIGS